MSSSNFLDEWVRRASNAKEDAHRLLARHEGAATSRVILLEDLLRSLSGVPVDVQDYFREAVICLENNLLRASVVLSWSGFFHILAERLYADHEEDLRTARSKWKFGSLVELKENHAESQILDAAKVVGLFGKAKLREYQGQLSVRNQCAHPTLHKPSLNGAIGYVDDMLREAKKYL